MEKVHKSEIRAWIAEPLNLEHMLKQIREDHFTNLMNFRTTDVLKMLFPNLQIDFNEMEETVCFDTMTSKQENKVGMVKTFEIPEMEPLHVVKSQKRDVDKRNSNPAYAMMICNDLKYLIYPDIMLSMDQKGQQEISPDFIEGAELLLTVQIYHPVRSVDKYQTSKISLDQEILVTGQQFLTDLRDFISCTSDAVIPGDYGDDVPSSLTCKDLYKSGFFYINATFYNDLRSPDAKDYSEDIINWAKEKGRGVGPFSACLMEQTRFIDLTIQLGYPYVYIHQGDCEHLLIFSDVRAMVKDDCLDRHSYPMMNRYIPKRRVLCMVCQIKTACWVITEHRQLPETPFFVCEVCLVGFFYTKDRKKIGEFVARKFVDRSLII